MNHRSFRSSRLLAGAVASAVTGLALTLLAIQPAGADPDGHAAGMAGMHETLPHGAFSFGEPAKPQQAGRTVTIVMKDASFEPSSLTVKPGETIRFVVINASELEHDFTLGDTATQVAHRREMAEMFKNGGAMQHAADANAIAVKPGETGELTWTFSKAGALEFDCNVPGHYESGMKGTIVVKP